METKKHLVIQNPQITNTTAHFQITYFSEWVKLSKEHTILTSKRLTWMHYPVTSGCLQFKNLKFHWKRKEKLACKKKHITRKKRFEFRLCMSCIFQLFLSVLYCQKAIILWPHFWFFFFLNAELMEKTKENAAKTFSLLFNFLQGT